MWIKSQPGKGPSNSNWQRQGKGLDGLIKPGLGAGSSSSLLLGSGYYLHGNNYPQPGDWSLKGTVLELGGRGQG